MEQLSVSAPEPIHRLPPVITEASLRALRDHRVTEAAVFGSAASGTDGPNSDVDLLVRFAEPVTLFDQLRLAEKLERISGRPVDLMTTIHPAFRPYIMPTLVPLSV